MDGWNADLSGPGKLCRAMRITRALNGIDLTGDELYLLDARGPAPQIVRSKRIGVDYADEWKHAPLRFSEAHNKAVSKPWPLSAPRRK
jgi:DNA-3-methyladenine glycosylase